MKKDLQKSVGWRKIQDDLADQNGLAIVLLEDEGLSPIHTSNDNSVCRNLTKSKEFSSECQRFCGKVYSSAIEEGKALKYKCHAGLECIAVPIEDSKGKKLVAITGRAFTKSDDYRVTTDRAISGDWKDFPLTSFFENILLTSSTQNLEDLAKQISGLSDEEKELLSKVKEKEQLKAQSTQKEAETDKKERPTEKVEKKIESEKEELSKLIEKFNKKTEEHTALVEKISKRKTEELREINAWRSLFSSLLNISYKKACQSILEFLRDRYDISSLAWLESRDGHLETILAIGALKKQQIQVSMASNDKRLINAVLDHSSVELRERKKSDSEDDAQIIKLFPIAVGEKIRSALVLGEKVNDRKINRQISKFCQTVAPELEILRLREELTRRSWLQVALHKFNESLKMIDTEDFWSRLLQTTAELLQAERGSLFVYDEKANQLTAKAAIGSKADLIRSQDIKIGKRIVDNVWKRGRALVVPDFSKLRIQPSPDDWKYKSESFISFPLAIGGRKIGVLNLTDKVDGGIYDDFDLQLLISIAPQIAVAIDRATLKSRAGEFEQLSVTDALTGLLNRRYLEKRLDEELKRSNRHGYPMSFMMIDVDNFKSYNDTYTHPEGDKALKLVGQTLKDTLRGADVAARYGGEEFSILLPQTNMEEANTIAERIRENIENTEFPNRKVTVSIGIASASMDLNTPDDLILAADKALFQAKEKGRNNVQIYQSSERELQVS